jgi:hypothetical protein
MELYVLIPFRDLDNKPPTIDPLQDWAFGIVLLNILYGTINILPENQLMQLINRVRFNFRKHGRNSMAGWLIFLLGIWPWYPPCQHSTSYKINRWSTCVWKYSCYGHS